jgi:hypothetical protein
MGLEFLRVAAWWRSGGSVEHGPGRDCAGLWIAGLAGLRGMAQWRSCGPEGWEFGGDPVGLRSAALAGLRSGVEDQRSHGLQSSGSVDLWDWRGNLK